MSYTLLIIVITLLLFVLVGYAYVTQTMETKRQKKQRLIMALHQRSKEFKSLIGGFPAGFLSKDISLLVYRCLIDVTEQLSRIEPNTSMHVEELALFTQKIDEVKRQPRDVHPPTLDSVQQVKEVKGLLQGLNVFLHHQKKKGAISPGEMQNYEAQIKQMVTRISVDGYLINAEQADTSGKPRLALHYYSLGKKLLEREQSQNSDPVKLKQVDDLIEALETRLNGLDPEYDVDKQNQAAKEATAKEWENFSPEEESEWMKKNVYD